MTEIVTSGLMSGERKRKPWSTYMGTKLETADTDKEDLTPPRRSPTLPFVRPFTLNTGYFGVYLLLSAFVRS